MIDPMNGSEVVKVIGWFTIGIIGFICVCISIGIMSVELKRWAISLYKFGRRLRGRR